MAAICYKMFFRKKGTFAAVLAIALLVAIVASMTAIVNFINSQTTQVSQLASIGNKYLVLNKNSLSLSDSVLSKETIEALNQSSVTSCFSQKIFPAKMHTSSGDFNVSIRGVDDVAAYLKAQRASLNGSYAKGSVEANIGLLLGEVCSVHMQDSVCVSVGNVKLNLNVTGTVRTLTQLDSELIVPLQTANILAGSDAVSFVEFTFKNNVNRQSVLTSLSDVLPSDASVVKVQQTSQFLQQSVGETLNFLFVWSIAVYLVVAAASYVVSTRMVINCDYELGVLKAIGAKSGSVFFWVFSSSVLVALIGSVLGLAVGLVGTQVASAVLRWFWQSIQINTYLEPLQVGQILLFSVVFSTIGCVYPAFKGMQRRL